MADQQEKVAEIIAKLSLAHQQIQQLPAQIKALQEVIATIQTPPIRDADLYPKKAAGLGGAPKTISLAEWVGDFLKSPEGQSGDLPERMYTDMLVFRDSFKQNLDSFLTYADALLSALGATPDPRSQVLNPMQGKLNLLLDGSTGKSDQQHFAPNGLLAESEDAAMLALDEQAAAKLAKEKKTTDANASARGKKDKSGPHFGVVDSVNEDVLSEAGWAVVVNAQEDVRMLQALSPLISWRCEQQGMQVPDLRFDGLRTCGEWLAKHYPTYIESPAKVAAIPWEQRSPVLIYDSKHSCSNWLGSFGVSSGPVDPKKGGLPFYLLLAGRPGPIAEGDGCFIPFDFQYDLDIYWGVGRLSFNDESGQHRFEDYATYAQQVVEWEQQQNGADLLRPEVVYYATNHGNGDQATELSANQLIAPLMQSHGDHQVLKNFTFQPYIADDASMSNLTQILRGQAGKAPALLFTASHGVGFPFNDKNQVLQQGSLVAQEWDGFGAIRRKQWFSGSDLYDMRAETNLRGTMAICFACYGAGSPRKDAFIFKPGEAKPDIAPFAFVAQLPQQLLLRGALAVLGHVERAWSYSFSDSKNMKQSQSGPFEQMIGRILDGKRLGFATDQFNLRQGSLASMLVEQLNSGKVSASAQAELGLYYIAYNDSRSYALIGDPAVKLPYTIVDCRLQISAICNLQSAICNLQSVNRRSLRCHR
jgi:hypothetical protein